MPARRSRRAFLATTGVATLAGCLGRLAPGSGGPGDDAGEDGGGAPQSGAGPPTRPESLPLPLERAAIAEKIISGGVPKDGIPAIEDPSFEPADAVGDRLAPGDPVFGVVGENEVKAYPQSILVWHEICNDTLDGRQVSVTYCPLTGTAMGYQRGETTFGVSGRLVHNNLVMYDRATETWWPQVLGTAIPGDWNPDPPRWVLRGFRVVWTTWERWRTVHPDTRVLTRDTGFAKNYDYDPYGAYNPREGYYRDDAGPMFGWLDRPDDRYPPKEVFIGSRAPDGAVAFRKASLREAGLLESTLGGTPVVGVHDPALDTGYVYRNPEGRSYEHDGEAVVGPDGERHPPDDLPLERVLALDAMWFAWIGFYPESSVHA